MEFKATPEISEAMDHQAKVRACARLCHEVNRAYAETIGDDFIPTWEDSLDWHKNSLIAGVLFRLANPNSTPENMHESWYALKLSEGWVYGEVKDTEAKTHPCMVAYQELPANQQVKDKLFSTIVTNYFKI